MVKITEDLIRKKSEHNEGLISTLEELSLHQEDVEKIEHLNNWCKDIQILLLQSNLIPKIENLNKLKKLEYLNLAVNNIEKIENLEKCESLEKLDLTLNFIGDIESVCSLSNNVHLKHLYLTGNPCCDYDGYRQYVIANVRQLETLDGKEITKTERLEAIRILPEIKHKVKEAQEKYEIFRAEQRERLRKPRTDLNDEEFWKTPSENAPEVRIEISERSRKSTENDKTKEKETKPVRLFAKDGRPLNVNQAKVDFKFSDEDLKQYVLDVSIYRHLDTNLLQVDLQTTYINILIKGKVFQLTFPEEIQIDKSTAKRSQTTGHLVVTMPKLNYNEPTYLIEKKEADNIKKDNIETQRRYLEVSEKNPIDYKNIVCNTQKAGYMNNPEVPPLEYGS